MLRRWCGSGCSEGFAPKVILSVLYKDGGDEEPLDRKKKEAGRLVMK